jgi:threonine dehydratase
MLPEQQTIVWSMDEMDIHAAAKRLKHIALQTPLTYNPTLSQQYQCEVYLKREDLQVVRSYKVRGAYNMLCSLTPEQLQRGVVCASAGNHAQGFAYSCNRLFLSDGITPVKGVVFMPVITPRQKINQVRMFGGDSIQIILAGDTFDDCATEAEEYAAVKRMTFIPPFDDWRIVEGQATVGMEIAAQLPGADFVFLPVGGGGLAAGVGAYYKTFFPGTRIIGAEPEGAPSMTKAFKAGYPVSLDHIDSFVDGAAVKRVGKYTFPICRQVLDDMLTVPEGRICSTLLSLYTKDAIVAEPAGALSVAALDQYADAIRGKRVVCIVSGSNNDIDRMQEIKEKSLQYEGLKHYFLIRFAQRPGALRTFVNEVLGEEDDITRFEYMKKNNKDTGPALVGIELKSADDYDRLLANMTTHQIAYTELNKDDTLFGYLV